MEFKKDSDGGFEMTGKEFEEWNVHQRLTNQNLEHNGHTFHRGLNVDTVEWQTGTCAPGGFYFTNCDEFYKWILYANTTMYYVWDVQIPSRARVYVDSRGNIKTNQIILENIRRIDRLREWEDPDIQHSAVTHDGNLIQFINEPSVTLQKLAVSKSLIALQYIQNPSNEIQIEAVMQDPSVIHFIRNPCRRAIDIATVKSNPIDIYMVENPDHLLQQLAIEANPKSMKFISNLDMDLAYKSLAKNYKCFDYVYHNDRTRMGNKAGKRIFPSAENAINMPWGDGAPSHHRHNCKL